MIFRKSLKFTADPTRVLLQFYRPLSDQRVKNIINRILSLNEGEVEKLLGEVLSNFSRRHRNFEELLLLHYSKVEAYIPKEFSISESRKLLTGSYFSKEYSVESAALFNPSIVAHPDQTGLKDGELRYVMSLRATGEGHISSIEFRTGIITSNNEIIPDPLTKYVTMASSREERVPTEFTIAEVKEANYNISFTGNEPLSERVIFPFSLTEKNGIEDVRFVKFTNDDGPPTYYGTFTAYDGVRILSQLIQTDDFVNFKIRTLHGDKAKDKGMAIFPRKINNKFTIISRLDGENFYFMQSDNLYLWESAEILRTPVYAWEFVQTGNSGSPIETNEGWLLITHSVGPLRRYVISAVLLDKENPSKVISYLDQPLLEPGEDEREGYVPNVVYSCGSIIHNNHLIIPYAVSDSASRIAVIELESLLQKFIPVKQQRK